MSNAHWLALTTLPGIGGVTARKLLERFGDVESIFSASFNELIEIPRITPTVAEKLLAAPIEALESELLSLNDEGIDLLTWDDDRFPAHLCALADAPMVLFIRGSIKRVDGRWLSWGLARRPRAPSDLRQRLVTSWLHAD